MAISLAMMLSRQCCCRLQIKFDLLTCHRPACFALALTGVSRLTPMAATLAAEAELLHDASNGDSCIFAAVDQIAVSCLSEVVLITWHADLQ